MRQLGCLCKGGVSSTTFMSLSFFSTSTTSLDQPGSLPSPNDVTDREEQEQLHSRLYVNRASTTWRQRLQLMWRLDPDGRPSPELNLVQEATTVSGLFGFVYGAYVHSQRILKIFLEKNKHEMFKHPREAQASLQDRMVLAYLQGGFRLGWRYALLTATYMSVAQSLAVIRNYINPLDHAAAGAVMGAVYKAHMGPRGMVGAGAAGAMIGLQAGCLFWLMQYLSGETVEARWAREYAYVLNQQSLEAAKLKDKDKRKELLADANQVVVVEDKESDWKRNVVITLRGWASALGLIDDNTFKSDET